MVLTLEEELAVTHWIVRLQDYCAPHLVRLGERLLAREERKNSTGQKEKRPAAATETRAIASVLNSKKNIQKNESFGFCIRSSASCK